jgi:hypothetical protein
MAQQQLENGGGWGPRLKDWLSIGFVIAVLVILGWIFVMEGIHH